MPWKYLIEDLKGEGIIGTFYKKDLQKTIQKRFRIEKVYRKRKDNKLCVKWKGYHNFLHD